MPAKYPVWSDRCKNPPPLCDSCSEVLDFGQHERHIWSFAKPESPCVLCSVVDRIITNVLAWEQQYRDRTRSDLTIYLTRCKWPFGETRQGAILEIRPTSGDRQGIHDVVSCIAIDEISRYEIKPRAIGEKADLEYIKTKLAKCDTSHRCCIEHRGRREHPAALKLIDCKRRQLVEDQKLQYLALSYVWYLESIAIVESRGDDLGCFRGDDARRDISRELPQTIEDAIAVTLALGYRYLWIDRVCIDQQNREETFAQINQMHLVYSCAAIVLVDAVGSDPSKGLSGVSLSRRPLVTQTSGNYSFSEVVVNDRVVHDSEYTLRYTGDYIRETPWSKRAWTLQEALFARRLLAFGSNGMYLECSRTVVGESGLPAYRIESGPQRLCNKSLIHWEETDPERAKELLEAYTIRKITYGRDSLHAIKGVLSNLEATIPKFRHCWGLPVWLPWAKQKVGTNEVLARAPDFRELCHSAFLHAITWLPGGEEDPSRNLAFPSWSWCGWLGTGPVSLPHVYQNANDTYDDEARTWLEDINVKLETETGDLLELSECLESDFLLGPTHMDQLSRFVHLKVWVTHARTELDLQDKLITLRPVASDVDSWHLYIHLNRVVEGRIMSWHGIRPIPAEVLLVHHTNPGRLAKSHRWEDGAMLVISKIDDVWERQSIVHVSPEICRKMTKTLMTLRIG